MAIKYTAKKTMGNGHQGIKVARPAAMKRMSATKRTVSRAYAGVLNHQEVKDRIVRAFLIEEFQRIKSMKAEKKEKKSKKAKKSKK